MYWRCPICGFLNSDVNNCMKCGFYDWEERLKNGNHHH